MQAILTLLDLFCGSLVLQLMEGCKEDAQKDSGNSVRIHVFVPLCNSVGFGAGLS